jgi:hypothetical protein
VTLCHLGLVIPEHEPQGIDHIVHPSCHVPVLHVLLLLLLLLLLLHVLLLHVLLLHHVLLLLHVLQTCQILLRWLKEKAPPVIMGARLMELEANDVRHRFHEAS